ncbi:MAG: hypothetical protein ACRC53_04550 [Plesiomonas sp.]|uniref:Dph6-related ATP pyrophosphatase n=1 Tax=Plesiomonas sp. TaxID=2486279 RepID=UPI003F3D14D9
MMKVLLSWSSGKDAMLALLRMQEDPNCHIVGLFTTYSASENEVPIQGTPIHVVRLQAQRMGLPLIEIPQPVWPNNRVYTTSVVEALQQSQLDFDTLAFGDLFLDGIAEFRRSYLEPHGWRTYFPLMGQPTTELAQEIIARNIETYLVSIDTTQLSGHFCGRRFDSSLLNQLPVQIDLCGERGEFHTLVINSPAYTHPLIVKWENIEKQERFYFQRYTAV